MNITYLDSYALNPGDLKWDGLHKLGNLTLYKDTPIDEIVTRLKESDIAIVNKIVITEEIIKQLPRLKMIAVTATGYDTVDTEAAKRFGITVTNIPAYSTESVAQMIFAHILQFTNRVYEHNKLVQDGVWQEHNCFSFWDSPQREIAGKTLGILGYGNIGKAVARIGASFGMKLICHSSSPHKNSDNLTFVSKEELLSSSDFLVLSCPLKEETKGWINSESLKLMKREAILINTGRGGLIDEADLSEALKSGTIAGAGLDVLQQEPPRKGSPLIGCPNCVITPHIAWATVEARQRALNITIDTVDAFIKGEPINRVN